MNNAQRRFLLFSSILILSAYAFIVRILPLLHSDVNAVNILSPDDPIYNLRLIELYVNNGSYQWFDPLSYYPYGLWLNWGPLFTIICAKLCLFVGATTPSDIAYVSSFVPPLMASGCVPLAYILGRCLKDVRTGIVAAIIMAFIGGQFFSRSVAGYLDHHTAEVFFSLLFIVAYVISIKYRSSWIISDGKWLLPGPTTLFTFATFSLLVLTMPTAILFAFIAFIFTFVWIWFDKDKDLAGLNILSFGASIGVFALLTEWSLGINLDTYSFIQIIAYATLAVTGILLVWKNGKYRNYFVVAGAAGLLLLAPIRDFIIQSILQFFGSTQYTATVQEARGWALPDALAVFNIAIPLTIFGIIILTYVFWKYRKPETLFVLMWCVIISIATIQHIRYEYYFAPVAAICTAYAIISGIDVIPKTPLEARSAVQHKSKKGGKIQTHQNSGVAVVRPLALFMTCAMVVVFCVVSTSTTIYFAENAKFGTNTEWLESLTWMNHNTPDPGMNFEIVYTDGIHVIPQSQYGNYVNSSYGVMSWWDYGHIIEYFGKRMPNANPFQSGVIGEYGSANFFTTSNEDTATKIADALGTRYVITDIEMATGKFWAMSTWANLNCAEYQDILYSENGQAQQVNKQPYYNTIVAKLHLFDGSYRKGQVIYVEYNANNVVKYGQLFNTTEEAQAFATSRQSSLFKGSFNADFKYAFVSTGMFEPSGEISALKHFRLVHESPSKIDDTNTFRYVKIFEYVTGANLYGDGYIYTNQMSNTGRTFVYGQWSENGKWVIPYSGEYVLPDGRTVLVDNVDVEIGGIVNV